MSKENKKLKALLISDKQQTMIEQVGDEIGSESFTAIIHYCLNFTHKKLLPNYIRQNNPDNIIKREITRKKVKESIKSVKEEVATQTKEDFCVKNLKGRVKDGICYFKTFSINEELDQDQEVPIEQCDEYLEETSLFHPDKDSVLESRPEVKKLFDK